MVYELFGLLQLFMFKSAMSYNMDKLDSTKLATYWFIQIWECVIKWCKLEPIHKRLLDICHLHGLGAGNRLGGQHILHMFFANPYVQMIVKWFANLHETQTQHILNIYCWIIF
jgi:hypothetical protein